MDDLAASSSFEVNCLMSATESSKDSLQTSPKRFQSAYLKLKLLFTLLLKCEDNVKNTDHCGQPRNIRRQCRVKPLPNQSLWSNMSNEQKFALQNLE
ncbi:hypothetical protein PoB_000704400 [Plakobranchus ocellatus]|uniref:Uncharacterized protein n=1 Tax=Plakobranchus ocellatus TaxID=259542 RepID=A0AAV3YE46_9GAST|nr:hypothetical protein PoB_000704400 [Plakobranchus ocellatus]